MKIACTTVYDAVDPQSFGGRMYHQLRAIHNQQRCLNTQREMTFIGPLSYFKYAPILLAKREYYQKIYNRRYFPRRDRRLVRDYARQIRRRLKDTNAQIIFSPMSPGSQPVAFLEARQPIVIWTDTTFAGVLDIYPEYMRQNMAAESLRDGIANERAALSRAAMVIFYSQWARQSAIDFYDLDPAKLRVIAAGPCLDDDAAINLVEAIESVRARPRNYCRLLFVGTGWDRKGGDTALEVAKRLNAAGLRVELIVVGPEPPANAPLPEFVRVLGYISRSTRDGAIKLAELFKTSHFLLLPTRADCSPNVLLEANSFALPSLATDVGGIPEIVRPGVNGATFPLSADPDRYCAYVEELFTNYDTYEQLALSAFGDFKTRLNNRTAASSVLNTMKELL